MSFHRAIKSYDLNIYFELVIAQERLLVLTAGAGNILRIAPALTVPVLLQMASVFVKSFDLHNFGLLGIAVGCFR